MVIPTVIESEGRVERAYDIYSHLLKDRIVLLEVKLDPYNQISNSVIAQLLFLQMQDPQKDINMYINSPGGSVSAGLAIYDTMQFVTCDINTYCIGMCASMGAVLLSAGTAEKICITKLRHHDPSGFGVERVVPHPMSKELLNTCTR